MVKLNMAINYSVAVVCPLCKAEHERTIENGKIFDCTKSGNYKETICPPRSACSKEPRTKKMLELRSQGKYAARNGEVVSHQDDLIMAERWLQHGNGD